MEVARERSSCILLKAERVGYIRAAQEQGNIIFLRNYCLALVNS